MSPYQDCTPNYLEQKCDGTAVLLVSPGDLSWAHSCLPFLLEEMRVAGGSAGGGLQQERWLSWQLMPVCPWAPSAAQKWLRPSQHTQPPALPPPGPPQAVDGDRKRLTQTPSWIKLGLGLKKKGRVQEEPWSSMSRD